MKSITINGTIYTCPYVDLLPPLDAQERNELEADIRQNGVLVPAMVTDANEVIDGHNRLQIAADLGLADVPVIVVPGLSADAKRERAEDLNLLRRHLTRDQRREIIARRLRSNPHRSDRDIAAKVGVDHKTVGVVRADLERSGVIPQLAVTRGRDGKPRKHRGVKSVARGQRGGEHTHKVASSITPARPSEQAARWSHLMHDAAILHQLAKELSRAARARKDARKPDDVRTVANRLQMVVDDLRRWLDRSPVESVPPAAET